MKRLILSLALIAATLCLAAGAEAFTLPPTANLDVSATVIPTCSVSTTALNFGSVTGLTYVLADGGVTVNCSPTAPYHIALNAGLHYGAGGYVGRFVSDGTNARDYSIYKESALANEWGDSDYANTYPWASSLADTGNGAGQLHGVYGVFRSGAALPPGAYSDTVTVTVYY